jgi:hypothetical protein
MTMILALLAALILAQPDPTATLENPSGVVARWEANTYAVQTGQPFTLTLRVELDPGFSLVPWDQFPMQWGAFEVQSIEPILETKRLDGGLIVSQSLHVILWQPQDVVTPDWFIAYTTKCGADIRLVPSRQAFISVPTVLDFNDQTLRPPRPPLTQTSLPWDLIVAVLTGALALFWRMRRRESASPLQTSPALMALSLLERDITQSPERRLSDLLNFMLAHDLLDAPQRTELEARLYDASQPVTHAEVDPLLLRARILLEARADA